MRKHIIYLDHAATTALDQRVLEVMMPYFTIQYGNASSSHTLGRYAIQSIDKARKQVAEILNCRPNEIVFTGSGSESNNLAIKGLAFATQTREGQILTTPIEHYSVLHTCQYLEQFGFQTTYLPVDPYGRIDPEDVARAITDQTILVSVMYANNEIGTIEPIAQIGRICHMRNVLFHVDAVQAGGSLLLDVARLHVDLMSLSAHKFSGPKGVGILYVRQGVALMPQVQGGLQERGQRAGTENVAGIMGAATALRLAYDDLPQVKPSIQMLRDQLIYEILTLPGSALSGHPTERLFNHASFIFAGIESNSLLLPLDLLGFAVSTGAACSAKLAKPSHVLLASGHSPAEARSGLRLTLGKENTQEDITAFLKVFPRVLTRLREHRPVTQANL